MRFTGVAAALCLSVMLAGCAEPTVDGSSDQAFFSSTGSMAASLEPREREIFTDALLLVTLSGIDFGTPLAEGEQLDVEGAIARLHGLSVEEVVALAEDHHLLDVE